MPRRRMPWVVWDESLFLPVDGALGCETVVRSLASLHANPAHSALRRARHFEDARENLERLVDKNRASASYDFGFFTQRYLMSRARRLQMWSVR